MFELLLIFLIDIIIFIISSTQIACGVVCVQYVQKQPPEVFFSKTFTNTYFEEQLRTSDQIWFKCEKDRLEIDTISAGPK